MLRQAIRELDDDDHAEDLTFGMAHVFCPDGKLSELGSRRHNLENHGQYWDLAMVMVHTGWTEAEIESRRRQGRLLELSTFASSTSPSRDAYPAEQFIPGFDADLLRFLRWIASMACSDWAMHEFLNNWSTPGARGELINGWAVMALPETPLEYQEVTDPVFKVASYRQGVE